MSCLKGLKTILKNLFQRKLYKIKILDHYELNENLSYYFDAAKIVNFIGKRKHPNNPK